MVSPFLTRKQEWAFSLLGKMPTSSLQAFESRCSSWPQPLTVWCWGAAVTALVASGHPYGKPGPGPPPGFGPEMAVNSKDQGKQVKMVEKEPRLRILNLNPWSPEQERMLWLQKRQERVGPRTPYQPGSKKAELAVRRPSPVSIEKQSLHFFFNKEKTVHTRDLKLIYYWGNTINGEKGER